jgi:uncharacterized protein (DUF58 family)
MTWAARRQGVDPIPVMLLRRRVYILPTAQGALFALSVFAMLLASLNYNNNLGLLLAFLLAGIGLAAMYRAQRNLAGIIVHVQPPPPVFAGDRLRFPIVLHHNGHHRFAIDGADEPVNVPAGRTVIATLEQATRRRGRQHLARFSLFTTFPLGLFRAWVWVDADVTGLAWPKLAAEAAPTAPGTGVGATEAGSKVEGDDDFAGLRAFREGDPLRRVDWHAVARGRGLMTKHFTAAPPSLEWYDIEALAGLPIESALSRLARSITDAEAAGANYGLKIGARALGPDRGTAHRDRCLAALALYGQ